jgi:hypothetical protein
VDTSGTTRSDWNDAGDVTRPRGGGSSDDGVLGVVALYAESAEASAVGVDPALGRAFALRKGDVFFVGKSPLPQEIPLPDGRKLVPSAWHLFPFTDEYAHISRRHLVIEMAGRGSVNLVDLSTNGIYLLGEGRHLRRGRGEAARIQTIASKETVILGVDLGASTDGSVRERAWRFQVQVIPVASVSAGSPPSGRGVS